jgi:hypothetical protein
METSITINNLSQAEIELIAQNRELELQKQIEIQNRINDKILKATNDIKGKCKKWAEQVEAAKEYYLDFDSNLYSLEIKEFMIEKDIYGDNYDDGVVEKIIMYASQATIIRNDYKRPINIEEHITYSSRWDVRGTNNGYKLTLLDDNYNTKYYKKAERVHNKIQEKIDAINAEKLSQLNKKNAVELNLESLKDKYKDAKIESSKEYKRSGKDYITIDVINVYLLNGVKIVNRVYENGRMSIYDVTFPGNGSDVTTIIDGLNSLSF